MPNLILTIASGDQVDYGGIVIPQMYNYARKCGADFQIVTGPSFGEVEADGRNACAAWWKLPMLRWFSQQDTYQRLMFVDADVFIPASADNIFEACEGDGIFLADDMFADRELPLWTAWVKENYPESSIPKPWRYKNTGVFVTDQISAREIALLDEEFSARSGRVGRWHEQDYAGMLLANTDLVRHLPARFNVPVPFMGNSFNKGDILHACGTPSHDRLKIFERMLAAEKKGALHI